LIIYLSADSNNSNLTPHSPGLRRRQTTNLSIGLMAHIASRTECCEFVIIVLTALQADGDAVTNASDHVVITGRLGHVY